MVNLFGWFVSKKKKEKPGLEVKFKVGEQLPWKGIWFEISRVDKDRILLKPVGMTWQRYKMIQEAKNGRQ